MIDRLITLAQAAGRNSVGLLILAILLVTLHDVESVRDVMRHVSSRFPSAAEEQEMLQRETAVTTAVRDVLDALRTETNADRVLLHRLKNGEFDVGGLPFAFATIWASATAPGVATDPRPIPIPTASYSDVMPALVAGRCAQIAPGTMRNPVFRQRLSDRGTESALVCPTLLGSQVIGFITVEWRSEGDRAPHTIATEIAARQVVDTLRLLQGPRRH